MLGNGVRQSSKATLIEGEDNGDGVADFQISVIGTRAMTERRQRVQSEPFNCLRPLS
jgi:hypothetical protein